MGHSFQRSVTKHNSDCRVLGATPLSAMMPKDFPQPFWIYETERVTAKALKYLPGQDRRADRISCRNAAK
jgi:hypothetical protein